MATAVSEAINGPVDGCSCQNWMCQRRVDMSCHLQQVPVALKTASLSIMEEGVFCQMTPVQNICRRRSCGAFGLMLELSARWEFYCYFLFSLSPSVLTDPPLYPVLCCILSSSCVHRLTFVICVTFACRSGCRAVSPSTSPCATSSSLCLPGACRFLPCITTSGVRCRSQACILCLVQLGLSMGCYITDPSAFAWHGLDIAKDLSGMA